MDINKLKEAMEHISDPIEFDDEMTGRSSRILYSIIKSGSYKTIAKHIGLSSQFFEMMLIITGSNIVRKEVTLSDVSIVGMLSDYIIHAGKEADALAEVPDWVPGVNEYCNNVMRVNFQKQEGGIQ